MEIAEATEEIFVLIENQLEMITYLEHLEQIFAGIIFLLGVSAGLLFFKILSDRVRVV